MQLVLLANAAPAFVVLTVFPGRTDDLFVWTVEPEASARLLAAMYGNAALLAALSLARRTWRETRITFVVFTVFSLAATIVTFFHLDPFLAHPRYFFVYWLVNYGFLCISTPAIFALQERIGGGRLAVAAPLRAFGRLAGALAALVCLATGIGMLIDSSWAAERWPWTLTPLVGRIVGVWLTALGAAFVWALWDGDARRTRPIFLQGLPTAALIAIAPALQRDDLAGGSSRFVSFVALVTALALAGVVGLMTPRVGPRAA